MTDSLTDPSLHVRPAGVAVGVIGPREIVARVVNTEGRSGRHQLVAAPVDTPRRTGEVAESIQEQVDVIMFTGRLQYDLADEGRGLSVPSTYIPVTGSSLALAVLRARAAGVDVDLKRVSIDTMSEADVAEFYDDIGVPLDGVKTTLYQGITALREFSEFHETHFREGETSHAITTIGSVAARLRAGGVPVLRVEPGSAAIREGLNRAELIGAGQRFRDAQLAAVVVDVRAATGPDQFGPSSYWHEELKLTIHRELLTQSRRIGATVRRMGENAFILHTSVGAVMKLTNGFSEIPFRAAIRSATGVESGIGIGLGTTAQQAEAHALEAVTRAQESGTSGAFVLGLSSAPVELGEDSNDQRPKSAGADRTVRAFLAIVDSREGVDDDSLIVDAETAAEVLGVTARTARRTLQALVEVGLAWPVPQMSSQSVGRPRQFFRLLPEKLGESLAEVRVE